MPDTCTDSNEWQVTGRAGRVLQRHRVKSTGPHLVDAVRDDGVEAAILHLILHTFTASPAGQQENFLAENRGQVPSLECDDHEPGAGAQLKLQSRLARAIASGGSGSPQPAHRFFENTDISCRMVWEGGVAAAYRVSINGRNGNARDVELLHRKQLWCMSACEGSAAGRGFFKHCLPATTKVSECLHRGDCGEAGSRRENEGSTCKSQDHR